MTKNRKKLILTTVMLTMMATLLSACSSTEADSSAQGVANTTSLEAVTLPPETLAQEEEITVANTIYGEVKSIGCNMVTLDLGTLPAEIEEALASGQMSTNSQMGGNRTEMMQGDGTTERPAVQTDEEGNAIRGEGTMGDATGENSQRLPLETDENGEIILPEGMEIPSLETDENGNIVLPEGMETPNLETDENGNIVIPEEFQGIMGSMSGMADMSEEEMQAFMEENADLIEGMMGDREGMMGAMGGMMSGFGGGSNLGDFELELTGENESYLIPTDLKIGFSDYSSIEKNDILSIDLDQNGDVVSVSILN